MKDQDYFDIVAGELQDRQVKPGLWTRAIAESGQDDGRARAAYIKLRIRELKEEDEQQPIVEGQPSLLEPNPPPA